MNSVSILVLCKLSVDNLSVTFKSLSLQSRYAEYWGLKVLFYESLRPNAEIITMSQVYSLQQINRYNDKCGKVSLQNCLQIVCRLSPYMPNRDKLQLSPKSRNALNKNVTLLFTAGGGGGPCQVTKYSIWHVYVSLRWHWTTRKLTFVETKPLGLIMQHLN
jgi:hypothetical protein